MKEETTVDLRWLTWAEIEPFIEQIIDMELDSMITFHYPDRKIPRSYPEQKVHELEKYLADGSTYFMGALRDGQLLGYHWVYVTNFIDTKRMRIRSTVLLPEARGLGLGKKVHVVSKQLAIDLGCADIATEYACFNDRVARVLEESGYHPVRVEVVQQLDYTELEKNRA